MTSKTPALRGPVGDADIRLLRIFRSVVESGGLSAAEIDLDMSVSAISIAVSDLEKRLGLRLCQRGRAGFALSDEGKEIYDASLQLMAALENFRTEVNSLHAQLRGELNIGITDNLVTMYQHMRVTHSLAALKRRGPGVQINIRMMPPGDIEKGVLDGHLHIGVVPELKILSGLNYLDLYDEASELYCGSAHALFETQDADLDEVTVCGQDAVVMSSQAPASARPVLQRLRAAASATDREGVAFLVLSGEYTGFLPKHYAERWVREGRMRALLPAHLNYRTRYAAITRKGGRPNLVLETYLEELSREENDLPQPRAFPTG
ncbi:MAG: LysR family transcriptional regulator [Pseudomonadota bacterium]